MPQCPQCNKTLRELSRRCPSCQADLELLVDYVNNMQGNVAKAEELVRNGELGQAVWAYLQILEVDPDNNVARRQVGMVATTVRQFDLTSPGRRWLTGGAGPDPKKLLVQRLLWYGGAAILIVAAFLLGFLLGAGDGADSPENSDPPVIQKEKNTLG